MPYGGFGGRGRGGFGRGRGMGYGFRGSSPPWPYVGRGRGGLPRGAYYCNATYSGYGQIPYPAYGEPDSLRDHAEMLKQQLEEIETRTRDLETRRE